MARPLVQQLASVRAEVATVTRRISDRRSAHKGRALLEAKRIRLVCKQLLIECRIETQRKPKRAVRRQARPVEQSGVHA